MGGVVGIVPRRLFSALQELPLLSRPFGGGDPVGVRARFGSYRGLARLLLAHFENGIGGYRRLKKIRWDRVERVVFRMPRQHLPQSVCRAARRDLRFAHGILWSIGGDRRASRPECAQCCGTTSDRACGASRLCGRGFRISQRRPADRHGATASTRDVAMSADGALPSDLAWPVEPASSPAHSRPAPFVRSILGAVLRRHRFRCAGHCRADASEPARWEIGRRTRRLSCWARIRRSASRSFAI